MKISSLLRPLKWIVMTLTVVTFFVLVSLTTLVITHFSGTVLPASLIPASADQGTGQQGRGVTCGIVFGAAVHKGDLPGPGISRRVRTAARLYQEGVLQHLILTGGKGEPGVESEAKVMEDVARKYGVAAGDLSLEEQARSTWENLLYSKPLTGSCTMVIAISDRYHLARIDYLASVQGWEDLRTLPSDDESTLPFELKSIGREVVALLYYMIITKMYPLSEIAQHGMSSVPGPDLLGLLITK